MLGQKLSSLTIFFPFYNDAGTVEKQIVDAYRFGEDVAEKLEVIAINGGNSKDNTFEEINRMKEMHPDLKVIDKPTNSEGYAVIKYGFKEAAGEWVFYTDGDAQYRLEGDLRSLVDKQFETGADVVNGYKVQRSDSAIRVLLGNIYERFSRFVFEIPIRDTDCDFRLVRKGILDKIDLVSTDASILPELIKKLELVGAKFAEVPVSHYSREYGVSNYTAIQLLKEKLLGDVTLYFKLRKMRSAYEKFRIFRFGLVGVISVILQYLFFNILITYYAQLKPFISVIIADHISIILAFFLNNYFAFNKTKFDNRSKLFPGFVKYYAVVVMSTFIQAFVVYMGNTLFGERLLISNIFWFVGLCFAFMWNYGIQSRIIWSKYNKK